MINSVHADSDKAERVFPMAKHYGAKLVGLTMDRKGIPKDAEDRTALAMELVAAADEFVYLIKTPVHDAVIAGLDAAICNVNDDDLMDVIATARILLNQEIYADSYAKVFKARKDA